MYFYLIGIQFQKCRFCFKSFFSKLRDRRCNKYVGNSLLENHVRFLFLKHKFCSHILFFDVLSLTQLIYFAVFYQRFRRFFFFFSDKKSVRRKRHAKNVMHRKCALLTVTIEVKITRNRFHSTSNTGARRCGERPVLRRRFCAVARVVAVRFVRKTPVKSAGRTFSFGTCFWFFAEPGRQVPTGYATWLFNNNFSIILPARFRAGRPRGYVNTTPSSRKSFKAGPAVRSYGNNAVLLTGDA